MDGFVTVTGIVLASAPAGEYDRRLVILTQERGKITAFAKGARRPKSTLAAQSRPFTFGVFSLYEGRNSYTVKYVEVKNYFSELSADMEGISYGFYFLEFAEYYTRENADELVVLKLLYQSLRALINCHIPDELVRLVFELKIMAVNGDYSDRFIRNGSEALRYTVDFILNSPVEKLYTFNLSESVLLELQNCVSGNFSFFIDKEFHSLQVLLSMKKGL